MKLLIKNGRVIDPASGKDGQYDVLVVDGTIKKVAKTIEEEADNVLDAKDCFVMPGLIDLHVHLREPGFEYKETIETGCRAAASGGFTTIVAMPNTKPVADSKEIIQLVQQKAESCSKVNVLQAGAITKGQLGQELADIEGMVSIGCPAISEDGKSVRNAHLYKQAMEIAAKKNIPVLAHCEDIDLVNSGVVNQDDRMKELNLPGISNCVEDVIIARDILLAKETGTKLHLCHCSTKDSVQLVKMAKEEGLSVTAEVCPHHFTLTTDDLDPQNSNFKMNPPLRTKEDVEALKLGLKNNIMDVISTDHAPHGEEEKKAGMLKAPFGIVGLETAVPLTITELVETGYLTPMQMAEKLSYNPAKVLGIDKGTLLEGKTADIVIINPNEEYSIDTAQFESKGKNTPFHGRRVKGKVCATIADGTIIYKR
ncbi:dihydroorotase [Anaerosacchariphilus polymeriproducens]|uniref:Dihydroorotase n=1 Tax=Anaerosacchariphilus polymeriproducens TaxID=1812858 RepID=A0A371AV79_9FIRM|nr:dihydroorotase [Anaerosacchariphilus polymeriproducens]RDU23380.1 dihydroorotase [Anaerosacchariphilus polymeriproducens]